MNNKCWIGIDPGKSGCLAVLEYDNSITFFDWPKTGNIAHYIDCLEDFFLETKLRPAMCVLERVHAMPKQGVSSMFSFGENFGMWEMWLIMKRWPHMLVPPQTWMKGFLSKGDGATTKQRTVAAAQKLYPEAELVGPKGGFKDGRADAALMAWYARGQAMPINEKDHKERRKLVSESRPRRRS